MLTPQLFLSVIQSDCFRDNGEVSIRICISSGSSPETDDAGGRFIAPSILY